eukprot:NODE_482_length_6938_cov_0.582541.p4 type:complete len:186 gc:universal NODE_482_length_6938_cov_0.582541:1605-1048(-)
MKQELFIKFNSKLKPFILEISNFTQPIHHFYIYFIYNDLKYYFHGTIISIKRLLMGLNTLQAQGHLIHLITSAKTLEINLPWLIIDNELKIPIHLDSKSILTSKINLFFEKGIICKEYRFKEHGQYIYIEDHGKYFKLMRIHAIIKLLNEYTPNIYKDHLLLTRIKAPVHVLHYHLERIKINEIL